MRIRAVELDQEYFKFMFRHQEIRTDYDFLLLGL